MLPISSSQAVACRCPCVASTSGLGPVLPRSAASGARSRKNNLQQQRLSTVAAAQLRSEAETLDSVSTLPVSWDEEDLTDERLSRALQARIERSGAQQPVSDDDTAPAAQMSHGYATTCRGLAATHCF
jgi:hypothetical protein